MEKHFKMKISWSWQSYVGQTQSCRRISSAELMKNLRHNNIVKILNCYAFPNMQVVLIMEFLYGGDLVEYLQEKGGLLEQEARILFRQITETIRYFHDKRLIYRDLKLENILLTFKIEKIIKIIDFGIATESINFTFDKVDRGSLSYTFKQLQLIQYQFKQYMPPELISGSTIEIKPSIDIWALGVTLDALECGNLPFTTKNDEQTIDNILLYNYSFPPSIMILILRQLHYRIYYLLYYNCSAQESIENQSRIKVFLNPDFNQKLIQINLY